MTEKNTTSKQAKKAVCSECGGERNCEIIAEYNQRGGDFHFDWLTCWQILKCAGCENVFIQTTSSNSEDYDNSYNEDGETETFYHETITYWPALSKRKKPIWMSDGGIDAENVESLNEALKELYGALNNDLNMLAAIGIRTSFDVASELLKINSDLPFKKKLDELVAAGHVDKRDRARLEILVDAGSASAHRGWRPKPEELNILMDALEHFIHDAFIIPSRKKRLDAALDKVKKRVPARKAKARKAPP